MVAKKPIKKAAPKKPTEERGIVSEAAWLAGWVSPATLAGIPVNSNTALQSPAVVCAITILSNDLSSLPIITYQQTDDTKDRAEEHPVYKLLKTRPNPITTASHLKKVFWQDVFLHGNGYLLVIRNGAGRPVELQNVSAQRITVKIDGLTYYYLVDSQQIVFPPDMIHVRFFFADDGIMGLSPIYLGRELIAQAIALDRYGSAFFGNSARPGGVLTFDGALSDVARQNLKRSFNELHQGSANTAKVAVIEQGGKYEQIVSQNNENQFIEAKQSVNIQLCQLFNLPPHKMKELGRATWGNLSSESLSYARDSLRPWTMALEEQFELKLFSAKEADTYFVEHQFAELLRADDLTRFQVYDLAVKNGILTTNECRELENRSPLETEDDSIPLDEDDVAEEQAQPPTQGSNGNPQPQPTA